MSWGTTVSQEKDNRWDSSIEKPFLGTISTRQGSKNSNGK
jgi:hypothetical protein